MRFKKFIYSVLLVLFTLKPRKMPAPPSRPPGA